MTPFRMHLDSAAVTFLIYTKPRTLEELCSVLGWRYAASGRVRVRLSSILTALEDEGLIGKRKIRSIPPRRGPRTTEFYWLHREPTSN